MINAILIFQTAHRVHGSEAQKFTEYVDNPVDKHDPRSDCRLRSANCRNLGRHKFLFTSQLQMFVFFDTAIYRCSEKHCVVKIETKRKKGHVPEEQVYRLPTKSSKGNLAIEFYFQERNAGRLLCVVPSLHPLDQEKSNCLIITYAALAMIFRPPQRNVPILGNRLKIDFYALYKLP